MSNTDTQAGPALEVNAEPRDLRRELAIAMRACTPKQRQWLKGLPEHSFQLWGKSRESLGISSNTISKWLRDGNVKRVREIQDEIAVEELDLTTRRVLTEYAHIAFADIRRLFREDGTLKHPDEWPDDVAAAVESIDTQQKRLRDPVSGEWIDEYELVKKIRTHNKLQALEFLAAFKKIAGARRIEVTGKDGEPLQSAPPVIQFVERADTD